MLLPFDPVGERDFWRETRLQYAIHDEPRVLETERDARAHAHLSRLMPAGT